MSLLIFKKEHKENTYFYEYGSNNFADDSTHGTPWARTYAITGTLVPETRTLALNWDFSVLTSSYSVASDTNIDFEVTDMSSGSNSALDRISGDNIYVGTSNKHYPGIGFGFPDSEKKVIRIEHVQTAKKSLPEMLNSYDMIDIMESSVDYNTFSPYSKPVNYYLSIEKNPYQNISDEMVNMFSSMTAFNNIIGEPVEKYRLE